MATPKQCRQELIYIWPYAEDQELQSLRGDEHDLFKPWDEERVYTRWRMDKILRHIKACEAHIAKLEGMLAGDVTRGEVMSQSRLHTLGAAAALVELGRQLCLAREARAKMRHRYNLEFHWLESWSAMYKEFANMTSHLDWDISKKLA